MIAIFKYSGDISVENKIPKASPEIAKSFFGRDESTEYRDHSILYYFFMFLRVRSILGYGAIIIINFICSESRSYRWTINFSSQLNDDPSTIFCVQMLKG